MVKETKKSVKSANATKSSKADTKVAKKTISKKAKNGKDEPAKKSRMTRRFNKLRIKSGDLSSKGILYVGHLPKGFNEEELKKYFGQFGAVTKIRQARSKKTGRSKGYAFLEFEEKEVAEIASKTMNGHIMFGKQLDCHMVSEPHRDTFKNGNRDWKFIPK